MGNKASNKSGSSAEQQSLKQQIRETQQISEQMDQQHKPKQQSIECNPFFSQLREFGRCRMLMRECFDSCEGADRLTVFPAVDEVTIGGEFSICTQQQVNGEAVSSLVELFETAETAKAIFDTIIVSMLDTLAIHSQAFVSAPLKSASRASDKARDDYGHRVPGPAVSWLFDIVRGSVICDSAEQIELIVAYLQNPPQQQLCELLRTNFACIADSPCERAAHIARLKNRFANPTPGGYRDLNINLQVPIGSSPNSMEMIYHMCELQIHLRPLYVLNHNIPSHKVYEFFRVYFRGNNESVEKRLSLLESVVGERSECQSIASIVAEASADCLSKRASDILDLLDLMNEGQQAIKLCKCQITAMQRKQSTSADVAEKLADLARRLYLANQIADSRNTYIEAIDMLKTCKGAEDSATIGTIASYVELLLAMGRYDEGTAVCMEATELSQRVYGNDHETTLIIMKSLWKIVYGRGRYKEATKVAERICLGLKNLLGSDHPQFLLACIDLAVSYQAIGKPKSSVSLLQAMLEKSEKLNGSENEVSLSTLRHLVYAHVDCEEYADGVACADKLLALDSPLPIPTRVCCATAFNAAGRYSEALSLSVLEPFEDSRGYMSDIIQQSALAELGLGQTEKAKESLVRAVRSCESNYGREHVKLGLAKWHLADVCMVLNQLPISKCLYVDAMESISQYGKHHHKVKKLEAIIDSLKDVPLGNIEDVIPPYTGNKYSFAYDFNGETISVKYA